MASRRVILFVDNWPALDVLVKGTSLQREWRDLLLLLEDPLEDNFMLWVARVPSASNVADHPSRGSTKELEFLKPFKMRRASLPYDENSFSSPRYAKADRGDITQNGHAVQTM